ncbi:MAG: 2-C-methyl-D-erythritol 4-phosphate cytidylyltransferase [Candidatus Amulumruptor caecigallinarius]|nr:2-C-methyl-D-erythritol 4-phosphate cytidylyltransferase [Candidatus Amulumruptor caecigallinarius]
MATEKYVLILAGGEGHRAGTEIPKQFINLCGVPMLWWSVRAFHRASPQAKIIVVLHPGFFADWNIMYSTLSEADRMIDVKVVAGGRTRNDSVKNGLMSVSCDSHSYVAVHDAARPMLTVAMIERGWRCAAEHSTAVPAVPLTDSLRIVEKEGSRAVDRCDYVAVQTPQIFRADIIKQACELEDSPGFTDDASRVEASGHKIALYEGDPSNMKVTTPVDFPIAETLLARRMMEPV